MNFGPETILWENSTGTPYGTGIGAHQWFTKTNVLYGGVGAATDLLDAPATGGIWTKVSTSGWDYVRVFGAIICTDAGSWTAARAGIMPYAFARGVGIKNSAQPADELLGVNVPTSSANLIGSGTRLTCSAVHHAAGGETDNILSSQDWSNVSRIHSGLAANETQPIAKFSGVATGQVRYWWYDIGIGSDLNVSSPYTQAILPGQPLQRLSGFPTIYVALKALNEDAWTGSGTFEIGGKVWAQPWREGFSTTRTWG